MKSLLSSPALVKNKPTVEVALNYIPKNATSAIKPIIIATYPRGMVREGSLRLVEAKIMYWAISASKTTRKKASINLMSI